MLVCFFLHGGLQGFFSSLFYLDPLSYKLLCVWIFLHIFYAFFMEISSSSVKYQLSRDDRIRINTLRSVDWIYEAIAVYIGCTQRQIQYSVNESNFTFKKRPGRPSQIDQFSVDMILDFVTANKANRQLPWSRIASFVNASWLTTRQISDILRWAEYFRYVARKKPPISETNKTKRFDWATEHVNWTKDQWNSILWTDETWATSGRHIKTYVIRRSEEALESTCIVNKIQRKQRWMFWGCFSGKKGKGPSPLWKKKWGIISKEIYCERIISLIDEWMRMNLEFELKLMQNGAPRHRAQFIIDELHERHIYFIFWSLYSPDLNPIEAVWNCMKDWMQDQYGEEKMNYDRLREMVLEVWNAVSNDYIDYLIAQMKDRCQAVIDAKGLYTKYWKVFKHIVIKPLQLPMQEKAY